MNSLKEIEKFNLIKPLPQNWPKNFEGIPFLRKDSLDDINWNNVKFASTANIKSTKNKENKILLNFQYDKTLVPIYNNIFKYALKAQDFLAVTTPDFSAYMNMEPWKIKENIIHSLWCGAWLQYLDVRVIPTITRADERTYDYCFNYIEKGSIIAISTIGVIRNKSTFIKGFNEMKKRIEPKLILVRGGLIDGMEGDFVFINFLETFEIKKEYEQLTLFNFEKIQTIRREMN